MSSNPLIQDLIENEAFPSVSVALPTGGRWYKDGVLHSNVDPLDMPVGVLGILAEQNYRDPWLLLSGEAIPRMLKGVCPSIKNALQLCELDLETILLASRLVSYGPKLDLIHKCTNLVDKEVEGGKEGDTEPLLCDHENDVILDINEHILRYAVIEDDVVAERFTYELKRVEQVVHLRPVPYQRVIEQMKDAVLREKQISSLNDVAIEDLIIDQEAMGRYAHIIDMASDSALDDIISGIRAIGTTDGKLVDGDEFIREWLLQLPTDEAEGITDKINDLSKWFLTFSEITYACAECGGENKFRLELDANRLFGQAGDSTQPKKPSRKSKSGARRRKIQ